MQSFDSYNFAGKKAIVRVDFNVPLNESFVITDDNRMRAAVPTLKKILSDGGAVVIMSHLGRPKNGPTPKYSLGHIKSHLDALLGVTSIFADDCISEAALQAKKDLKMGQVLLLENLRFYPEEEKGDVEFSRKLAEGVDVYVNDAFGTAHRAHASTTIIAQFFPEAKLFGFIMENEVNSIDKVLHGAKRPFTAIVGGSKVSSKITIIENLLNKVDNLIIGGGMIFTFIKAQGGSIGKSICEDDKFETALAIIEKAKAKNVKLFFGTDVVVADAFSEDANTVICNADAIEGDGMGLDIGPATIAEFTEVIENSATILWNGPVGVFEMKKFEDGTKKIAEAIAAATAKGAFSLIGGGDSVAAINKFELAEKVSYVSTGGGALLEYMEGIELPGIKAIRG